jgi:3',5'-cyclic AMP phosphodiesterase CpdA
VAVFRFIHLSDFHFCLHPLRRNLKMLHRRRLWEQIDSLRNQTRDLGITTLISPSSYDPAITAAVARFCYDRRNIIDAIVVSGDLATTGKVVDLASAKSFIEDAALAPPVRGLFGQAGSAAMTRQSSGWAAAMSANCPSPTPRMVGRHALNKFQATASIASTCSGIS